MKSEELIEKLAGNGVEYKSSDFKAEVHFIGQIIGASNNIEEHGIFCEAYFEQGPEPDWVPLCPVSAIQTQTAYNEV